MTTPALRIPIRADVSQFQNDMKATSSIAGTAVRQITKSVIDLNAGFLTTQGVAGGAALAFRAYSAYWGLSRSRGCGCQRVQADGLRHDLAKAKIAEFNDIADQANKSNVSTDFFQRSANQAPRSCRSIR